DAVHLDEARALLGARFGGVGVGSVGADRAGRIALIGLRGAGKSTLGARLAAACGTGFTELDRAIEQEAGIELPAILELHGQAAFRRFERAALDRWLAATNAGVLAAGGSIVAEPETYARLLEGCRTVWLRTSAAEHMARVAAQGDLRPMRGNPRAMADLHAILSSREALYARADLVLDTSGASVAESLGALRRLLGENGASA
ncbi:MAG TPA: shikimate kinase, partial [Acetobacteraceae bacterium]|nr:shikimate kinase [Acetobacteraceae bacterium]